MPQEYSFDAAIHELPEKGGAYLIFHGTSAKSLAGAV